MLNIKKILKQNYFLIGLILIISSFHFLWLDRVPPGMSHDEVVYSLSSKTFNLQGTDITGTGFPIGLFKTETEGNISILPLMLLSPVHFFLEQTQQSARFPYVIFIHLSALAIFVIAKNLFENEKIGIIAFLLFLLAPWSFFLARFAAEPPIALVFYLWAIATLFMFRGKKLLLPFFLFVLAFFSYHGGKVLFLPLVVACLGYFIYQNRLSKKEALVFFLGTVFVFVSFFTTSLSLPGGIVGERKNEIFFLNQELLTKEVNAKRKIVLENPFTPIFVNKATIAGAIFFQKYSTAFSPRVLFLEGDTRLVYSFFYHGLLYVFDVIFILVGIVCLFLKQKKPVVFFLLTLLLIAPLPAAVNGIENSYINRSSFLLPVLMIISAYGVYNIFIIATEKFSKILVMVALIAGPGIFVFNFLFFYFFQYPVAVADYYSLGEKTAAYFIKHSWDGEQDIEVVKNEPGNLYLETVFFFQDEKITNTFLQNMDEFRNNVYKLPRVTFEGDCPTEFDKETVYIIQDVKVCELPFAKSYTLKSPRDGGGVYTIYNSSLCKDYQIQSWLRYHYSKDFDMESMDTRTFCERWVSGV